MSEEFNFTTISGVQAFLAQVPRRSDDQGVIADIDVEDLLKLEEFKASLDLSAYDATFEGTNRATADTRYDGFEWTLQIEGIGNAVLIMNEPYEAEHVGVWASVYLDNEPYWEGNDPYECTMVQVGAIFNALPEQEKEVILELLGKHPEHAAALREAAGLHDTRNGMR